MSDGDVIEAHGVEQRLRTAHGVEVVVNRDINLSIAASEFVAVIGPSGGGKTTLLRTLAGFRPPTAGSLTHLGEPLTGVPPWLSIVFQEYNKSLFPWMTVEKNVALAVRHLPRRERATRVREILERVGLRGVLSRYPWELSGGMQQRVAVARALIGRPQLILFDEPFASVDALTRGSLQDMVLELWREARFAALLITHDIGEAIYMSDRVIVLSARPSTVVGEATVPLQRPRTQLESRAAEGFINLERRLTQMVYEAGGKARSAVPQSVAAGDDGQDVIMSDHV